MFCREMQKLTPLDTVLEHLFCSFRVNLGTSVIKKCAKNDALSLVLEHPFCSFRVNLGTSVIKKCAKNDALDPVLEHLFVVSELTWEHP